LKILNTSPRLIAGLAALAGLFCVRTAYAIDPHRAMSQYVRDRWGVEKGFPKGPVYAITQTTDGYLWIGTEAGLVRFDGRNFKFIKDDSGGFTIAGVLGLTPDNDGSLWVRLVDLTLVRYRNGVFEHPSSDPAPYVEISAINRGTNGDVLISKITDDPATHQQGIITPLSFRSGRFQSLAPGGPLPQSAVISLAQTPNGDIWMGSREAGLFHFSSGATSSIRKGLPDPKVNCLLADGDKDLWIGTDGGVVRWNGTELTGAGIPASLTRFQALAMAKDRDGNIWVGTDSRGLLRFNSGGVTSLHESDGVSHEAVTAVFEDREGNLWIGGADGIERLRDSAFVSYSLPEGIPSDGSNPVFVDSENRMWFPPVAGGLWWVKDGHHGHVTSAGIEKDVVYSIAGGNGDLWLGRQRGGLTHLHPEGSSFAVKSYTHADGLAQDSVYSVYLARNGTVWAGTLSAGVSMLRDGAFTNYSIANGLASNTVASILEASDGTMWFATPSGLSTLVKNDWKAYGVRDGLPSENANCLLEDSTGVLWVGTASGLAFRGAGGFEVPKNVPAALRDQVLGIAEDKYGSLWVATTSHVLRVNRDKLFHGALAEGDVREFGLADGLRGVEGVKRHRSVVRDPAGRIWFSLNRGISVVDPARLTRDAAPAIVHVQAISADGSSIRLADTVHIPGGRQRITFGFTGLNLSVPDRVQFRYQLEGFDHGWSPPNESPETGYTNLSHGSYRFRVIASNADGVWNSNEAVVALEVDPLYWQTWWFGASCLVVAMAVTFGLYRFRLHQLTGRLHLRFEERLAERTRIAQELHDTLLQGFLSVSMQVHVAADSLPATSQAKPILTRALQLMGQVIEEGRNAVRGLRSSQSASLDLEHAFSLIPQELAPKEQSDPKLDFRVIVDGEQRPLHPVLRDEVYRIGREALLNAFRHAQAKTIEIELKYSPSQLRVLVRDDGCGIDPDILRTGREKHWGLSGMRERADRIGARLHLFSSAAAGTEIELSVPGHVAFEDQRPRNSLWFTRKNGKTK
jgi:ligand-binding sensor domain-containing protein/signal transduction histidine kinase